MASKYVGYFKTDLETAPRKCVVLSYGRPLNNDFTEFDFSTCLIVDLDSIGSNIGDYLLEVAHNSDAQRSAGGLIRYARTRSYDRNGESEDLVSHLVRNNNIRQVKPDQVILQLGSEVNPNNVKLTVVVDAIQKELAKTGGKVKYTEQEELPLIERSEGTTPEFREPQETVPNFEEVITELNEVPVFTPNQAPLRAEEEENAELRALVTQLAEAVNALQKNVEALSKPAPKAKASSKPKTKKEETAKKPGRPKKNTTSA